MELKRVDIDNSGFKPAQFKSSRSSKFKPKEDSGFSNKDIGHESAIFGIKTITSSSINTTESQPTVRNREDCSAVKTDTKVGINKSQEFVNNTIMHDRVNLNEKKTSSFKFQANRFYCFYNLKLFEDQATRIARWRSKWTEMIKEI